MPGRRGNESNENRSNAGNESSALLRFIKKNPVFFTIIVSLVIMAAGYFWMNFQSDRQFKRLENEAASRVEQNNHDMLRLFTRPMVWSIRSEMLRGNKEQVDMLISDIVREDNFQHIFVVNAEGEIFSSTNKRQEGQKATDYVDAEMLSMNATTIVQGEDNVLTLYSPILGFDRRIGTLVIEYIPLKFELATP
ncbi:MAG: hypothetical protein EA361_19850 [Bacteroidetes bacterium]|nr:MAG: hypothetical protein EA361_19850 [Bacteroidota bacterium]